MSLPYPPLDSSAPISYKSKSPSYVLVRIVSIPLTIVDDAHDDDDDDAMQ
jgi:hypothetical protein